MTALALLLGLLASHPAAGAGDGRLPSALDAAGAYDQMVAEPCWVLIDQCEGYWDPTGAEQIEGLACRPLPRDLARCRFEVAGRRCRADFARDETGDGTEWIATRDFTRVPRRLLVSCRPVRR